MRDFDAALTGNPKHFVAMLNRALCRMAQDDLDGALRDLNSAIALNRQFPEALNNRGVVYARKKDYRRAVVDFTSALRIDSGYIDAYGNRASANRNLKMYKLASNDLKTAIAKAPLDYKPVNDLAWFYSTVDNAEERNPDKAIELATKACEMTSYKDANALDTLAAAYASKGDFDKAKEWILTAIELAPEAEKARLEQHMEILNTGKPIIK